MGGQRRGVSKCWPAAALLTPQHLTTAARVGRECSRFSLRLKNITGNNVFSISMYHFSTTIFILECFRNLLPIGKVILISYFIFFSESLQTIFIAVFWAWTKAGQAVKGLRRYGASLTTGCVASLASQTHAPWKELVDVHLWLNSWFYNYSNFSLISLHNVLILSSSDYGH